MELAMMKIIIKCPVSPDTEPAVRHAAHKAHIRRILKIHKYEGLDRAWVRRYHSWAGHLSRLPPERWAKQAMLERNISWWREQQKLDTGYRHEKRRGNISRWENALSRHHPAHAEWHREGGEQRALEKYLPCFRV